MSTAGISPWFSYTDEHGAIHSVHIPNLFDSVQKLSKKIQDLSNIFLNIKFNSDLFLKVMRLEQREIAMNQEIARLKAKLND